MFRRVVRLKAEIRSQEAVLGARRQLLGLCCERLQARYRNRLTSPSTLVASLVSGLIVGALARRPRKTRIPWLRLARKFGSPALLYILRSQAARWMHKAGL